MSILDDIIARKKVEVAEAKLLAPRHVLERSEFFSAPKVSLVQALNESGASGIIAEFKRRSPSKGILNANASVERVTRGYIEAGASALSILTDTKFFGGTNDDVRAARRGNRCPILRKDFTIDEYQIVEAKSIGADVILLIASALVATQAAALARFAHSLGLEVLLEVHGSDELEKTADVDADLIGVNNRNLKTFEVSVDTSRRLAGLIPGPVAKVAESGISDPATIHDLRDYGYHGFLVGERFMKATNPEQAAQVFIENLRKSGKAKA